MVMAIELWYGQVFQMEQDKVPNTVEGPVEDVHRHLH